MCHARQPADNGLGLIMPIVSKPRDERRQPERLAKLDKLYADGLPGLVKQDQLQLQVPVVHGDVLGAVRAACVEQPGIALVYGGGVVDLPRDAQEDRPFRPAPASGGSERGTGGPARSDTSAGQRYRPASGRGAMRGGGPVTPRLPCVPMWIGPTSSYVSRCVRTMCGVNSITMSVDCADSSLAEKSCLRMGRRSRPGNPFRI